MATHFKGNPAEVQALDAYIKMMRAANSVTAVINKALIEDNLTPSQFGILEALYHLGDLQQHTLGDKLLKSGGNITTVVDNLEKRKLIVRERCKADRRCIWVKLTKDGRQLISVVFPKIAKLIGSAMNTVSAEELAQFGDLSKRIGSSVAALA
jgi:MarR family transcriptional regulator, 2-MHQ and catechol-resistance regulon repressor